MTAENSPIGNSKTAARHTKKGLLGIIDALPLAIVVLDNERNIILMNQCAVNFADTSKGKMIGKKGGEALQCIHCDESILGCGFAEECKTCKLCRTIVNTFEDGKARYDVQAQMTFKHLGNRDLKFSSLPLLLNDQGVILLTIEDITDRKKFERTRLEKEKLSAVVETAGAICHKINQPLMCILGFSDLLLEDLPENNRQRKNLREIKKQVEELGKITEKLMKITIYSTQDYLDAEIIDIDESVKGK